MRRGSITAILGMLLMLASVTLAVAATTPTECDSLSPKYWCLYVDYLPDTPDAQTTSVRYLYFTGGLGGSADYFYVWRDEYWRQDPSSGTWYHLTSYAPSPIYSDPYLNYAWHSLGNGGYYLSDWAMVQVQMRHHKNDNSGFFCGAIIEFHLSSPTGPHDVDAGQGGPC